MGTFLYNIVLRLYAVAIFLIQPFSSKAKSWYIGRCRIWSRLVETFAENSQKVIWIHVASLGEFEQGRPLIEKIKEQKGDEYKVLLTFFSPSGYEMRKDYPLADSVYYLPLDTARNAKRFLDIVKPSLIYFVKYDYWYHYLHETNKRNIPLYIISSIFRKEQIFFKPYGAFYRKILSFFTKIFVQEQESKSLLQHIGIDSVVAGDTRVDRVAALARRNHEIPNVLDFKQDELLLIAGSSWEKDEDLFIEYLENHPPLDYKLIIAPHEVHEKRVKQLCEKFKPFKPLRYSQITEKKELQESKILIIDSVGMLSALYKYGDIAYIGGGFGVGIHNTLEPATFSLPIIFGKKYKKFNEARILLEKGGAFSVSNYAEFEKILDNLLKKETLRIESGTVSRRFIEENQGAVSRILKATLV